MIKTYKDLKIWQKAIKLTIQIYKTIKKFPESEIYNLNIQIKKAVISIPSNIAEGYGRNSSKDYLRFLKIAMGSLFELQTQILISKELEYIDPNEYCELEGNMKEIERMTSSMIRKINYSINKK